MYTETPTPLSAAPPLHIYNPPLLIVSPFSKNIHPSLPLKTLTALNGASLRRLYLKVVGKHLLRHYDELERLFTRSYKRRLLNGDR